ncbi:MAG: hypothetical protein HON76_03590 [Candidatus Scalindua sp.]|jgi:hypothetical protein|nr:hypothetical protein [Candidatus Scalindua sp.]MBT5304706.1 hypothetical protein [Candidatus Scalindua sp.]MBT6051182.1 hypothetical protein [Candidatus Scalindua sp.]MBT6230800.1 hypothetical protein [Candidatus Scalindua sp.]MBT6561591.1 hypothetical protein [Candidatus Scalindua sp.]
MKLSIYGLVLAILIISYATISRAEEPANKPWHITLTAGMGHNDNVPRVDGSLLLSDVLANIKRRESLLGRFTVDATYDLIRTDQHILTLGYNMFTDRNFSGGNLDKLDYLEHGIWVGYQKKLTPNTIGSLKLSGRYNSYGTHHVRNVAGIEPAIVYRLNNILSVGLNGLFQMNDLKNRPLFGGARNADQSGEVYQLTPVVYFSVPNTGIKANVRYRTGRNRTEGGGFDYNEDAVSAGISLQLPWQVSADMTFWHYWRDYDDLGPTVTRERKDDIDTYKVIATRPITDSTQFYINFEHTQMQSNGVFFEYRQNVVTSGIIITF